VSVVSANADDQQDHSCVSHPTLVPSSLKGRFTRHLGSDSYPAIASQAPS
jgi:hypothetical protein